MPVVEIYTLPTQNQETLQSLPQQVAGNLAANLNWDIQRFVVRVTELDPASLFLDGVRGSELTCGYSYVHITCAGGKSQEENQTIIRTVEETIHAQLGIPHDHIAILYQPLQAGHLYINQRFL